LASDDAALHGWGSGRTRDAGKTMNPIHSLSRCLMKKVSQSGCKNEPSVNCASATDLLAAETASSSAAALSAIAFKFTSMLYRPWPYSYQSPRISCQVAE